MFISTVVCLVPVVDCSEAVGVVEMTEVTVTFCVFFVAYINFITITCMLQVAVLSYMNPYQGIMKFFLTFCRMRKSCVLQRLSSKTLCYNLWTGKFLN